VQESIKPVVRPMTRICTSVQDCHKVSSCSWDIHSLWDNGGHPRNVSTPTPNVVPGLSCPRMYLGTTEDISGMSQLPPPLHVVPGLSCPRMYLGTTEDIPGISQLPPPYLSCPRMYLGTTEDIPGMSQFPPPLQVVPGLIVVPGCT